MRIPITKSSHHAIIDNRFADAIARAGPWHALVSGNNVYARSGKGVLMHRFIFSLARAGVLDTIQVDHINGNGLDNRLMNLRLVTATTNQMNRGKTVQNACGYKGVWRAPKNLAKPWRARVCIGGRYKYLGYHETAEDAARAYDDEARKHGCRHLNFPESQ